MSADMTDSLIKLGVGGAGMWFTLQIYQKTIDFLGKKRKEDKSPEDTAGAQPKEFWMKTFQDILRDELAKNVHTFASEPDSYWRNMDATLEKSVSKPLSVILDRQTEILGRLAEYAAEERGASKAKARR
jgi:hypothetical protein